MTSFVMQTDAEIMLRIAGYDSKALEQLYDRYSPMLFALIRKIIPNQKTAEEILAEVFVLVWKYIDQFDFKSSNVYTWLITLARNNAVDVLRREQGYEKRKYTIEFEREEIIPKLSKEIKHLELSDVAAMRDRIELGLNNLSDAQKYVVELAYYNGLDESAIAERLKIPISSVKSKLQLATSNLVKKIY